ncbi:MAG TPA: MASE4 domain-containing protein [Acidobacteriota bacterium]|nr:MASE4 domain-containing protein [Acidobacteriota bacterium]
MKAIGSIGERRLFLTTALATRRQQQVALAIATVAAVGFLAAIPFARVPLAKFPAFIPSYEAALFFIDLITAVLLLEQFVRLRSIPILVLASGYLFDALLIVPHALTFPGAFAPTGLLGAKEQTTAWLYVFWHGGFPLFVVAYALLRRKKRNVPESLTSNPYKAILVAIVAVAMLAICLSALTTVGHDLLPIVMRGSDYSLLVKKGVSPAVWALTLVAMVLLWQRPQRVIDLWLMLVMWIWLFDIALAAVIGSSRFDLGFYVGRIFGLVAASFLLIMLLGEMARLYFSALGAVADIEQRFAALASARAPNPVSGVREKPENFVRRQNISHYRELLATGQIDDKRRRAIEKLLAEEEALLARDAASTIGRGPQQDTPH